MKAEILLGATGWAAGSQICSGMTPALIPNPTKKRKKAAVRCDSESLAPML
jgi:hypothetical protein